MDRSPGGNLGGYSGVTHISHIVLDKINVNLTEKSLDLVNFVWSADALQRGWAYYHPPLLAGNGNRGRGVFLVYPPGRKFFENTPPPGDFGTSRHFFLNERKTLKFTLI